MIRRPSNALTQGQASSILDVPEGPRDGKCNLRMDKVSPDPQRSDGESQSEEK